MKGPRFLLRLLHVHSEEWWVVQKLFYLQFFQGAGIAFFSTSAYALFLHEYSIQQLPRELAYAFIYSAFLLWIAGFFYAKLEKRYSILQLARILTVFMGFSILLFRVGFSWIGTEAYFFGVLAWSSVIYLLNNLLFWGLAALLFDVRQSKRLFGVISAGDIPAKMVGFLAAYAVVKTIGSENLMWGSATLMFISLIFLNQIARSGQVLHPVHKHPEHKPSGFTDKVTHLMKNFSGNVLIRRIALLSVIISISFIIVNYSFYAEVKKRFEDDVQLARFVALFLAVVCIAAMVVKMVFTSQLLNRLGIIKALLITPLIVLGLSLVLLLSDSLSFTQSTIFFIVGASAILIDISRIAINTPIFLTLMQPLSTHERLRAHTIVKGIMDPFAFLITGTILLILINFQKNVSVKSISVLLLLMGVAWVIGVFRINQEYLKTLIKTISTRFFGQDDFNFQDKATQEKLREKIENGNELEVLYVLKMLDSSRGEQNPILILKALHHPSLLVINEAIRIVAVHKLKEADIILKQLIQNHPDADIKANAIRTLGKVSYDESFVLPYLEDNHLAIRQAAIAALINFGSTSAANRSETFLNQMLESADPNLRKTGVSIIQELQTNQFDDRLTRLLNDPDNAVEESVIRAIGASGNSALYPHLLQKWKGREKMISEVLLKAGETSIPAIMDYVMKAGTGQKDREKLYSVIAKIGGEKAQNGLLDILGRKPLESVAVIRALNRSRYHPTPKQQSLFEKITHEFLINAVEILYMQKKLDPRSERYNLLFNSLQFELNETRDVLLCLFGFLYDRDKITKVRNALHMKQKEVQANALELIDMTVKKDFAHPFNTIYEQGDIEYRCDILKYIFPKDKFPNIEEVLTRILDEPDFLFNQWTRACSLYTSKKYVHPIDRRVIKKYLESDNTLLKETAEYAI